MQTVFGALQINTHSLYRKKTNQRQNETKPSTFLTYSHFRTGLASLPSPTSGNHLVCIPPSQGHHHSQGRTPTGSLPDVCPLCIPPSTGHHLMSLLAQNLSHLAITAITQVFYVTVHLLYVPNSFCQLSLSLSNWLLVTLKQDSKSPDGTWKPFMTLIYLSSISSYQWSPEHH